MCEALDLVLGPDRLNRFPAVEEFDFYNSQYLSPPQTEGEPPTPVLIKIEVDRCGRRNPRTAAGARVPSAA